MKSKLITHTFLRTITFGTAKRRTLFSVTNAQQTHIAKQMGISTQSVDQLIKNGHIDLNIKRLTPCQKKQQDN